jgi:hypothetical protein
MQMPSLAFAELSLPPPPILITSTTTQLVLNIIYFINPINKLASIETGKYLISDLAVCSTTEEEVRSKP